MSIPRNWRGGAASGRARRAKAVIEARAKERHERERAEYEAKLAAREAKADRQARSPAAGRRSRRSKGRCRPIRSI